MIRSRAALLSLLVLGTVGADASWAQEPSLGEGQELELRSDLVLVPAAVRRERGGAVVDLAAADFAVAEDGRPQAIEVFSHDTAPVDVVLVVDASMSVEGSLDVMRTAANAFVKQLRPEDRVSIVAFADRPVIVQDWTADPKAAAAALRAIRAAGSTVLYGSVAAALAERYQASAPPRRRAMIVMTDGVDTLSTVTSRATARVAQRVEASV
jgi:Ca-activated chloride channel family protein